MTSLSAEILLFLTCNPLTRVVKIYLLFLLLSKHSHTHTVRRLLSHTIPGAAACTSVLMMNTSSCRTPLGLLAPFPLISPKRVKRRKKTWRVGGWWPTVAVIRSGFPRWSALVQSSLKTELDAVQWGAFCTSINRINGTQPRRGKVGRESFRLIWGAGRCPFTLR